LTVETERAQGELNNITHESQRLTVDSGDVISVQVNKARYSQTEGLTSAVTIINIDINVEIFCQYSNISLSANVTICIGMAGTHKEKMKSRHGV